LDIEARCDDRDGHAMWHAGRARFHFLQVVRAGCHFQNDVHFTRHRRRFLWLLRFGAFPVARA
jgi:hypothetical protein